MLNEIWTNLDNMGLIEVVMGIGIKYFIPILLIIALYVVSVSEVLNTDPRLRTIEKPSLPPNRRPNIEWTRTPRGEVFIFDTKDSSGAIPIAMFQKLPQTENAVFRVHYMIHRGVIIRFTYNMWYSSHVIKRSVNTAFIALGCMVDTRGISLTIDAKGKALIRKAEERKKTLPPHLYPEK